MIFKKNMVKTERFTLQGTFEVDSPIYKGFYSDIILDNKTETYEVYLRHENYGIKEFVVGFPVHGTHYGQPITETLDSVLEMAAYQLETAIPAYIDDYMTE